MIKKDFNYKSSDGQTMIHAIEWMPNKKPKAILQIVHGMTEYVDRYDNFAAFLVTKGYLVVGEDHLGHGGSVKSEEDYGYFGDNGNEWIIADIHKLRMMYQEKYHDIPYFILGHSMGSFLVRQYITEQEAKYAMELAGVIIMGTAWQPNAALSMGKAVSKMLGTTKKQKRTKLVELMAFGTYLKRIKNPKSSKDWLSRDRAIVDKYRQDKLCMFHFTPNAFYHMFDGMQKAHDISRIEKLPPGLPLLFISGAEDPVGSWGEGVRKAYMVYTENSKCVVDIKLYPEDRHEILNELNKNEVYQDLYDYMEEIINK